jgi:hypothetical protein
MRQIFMNSNSVSWLLIGIGYGIMAIITIGCNHSPGSNSGLRPKDTSSNVILSDSINLKKNADTGTALPAPGKSEILDGWLKLGISGEQIVHRLGAPQKGRNKYWGALGTYIQEWRYPIGGVTLEMESETEAGEKTISRGGITIIAPCTMKTSQMIGIGSLKKDVVKWYGGLIDTTNSDEEKIVVGTIYGGTIFTFVNGRVSQIFIGAAAE